MHCFNLLLALVIGLVIPLQAAVNNQLKGVIGGSTVLAAFVSFLCGTITLGLVTLFSGERWRGLGQLGQTEWWQLTGGPMGALFVFGTTLLAPRLGVAAMLALIICGQIASSLMFDRFGVLGLPLREISTPRLIGAALVVAGVLLVNSGDRIGRG
jgi:transporter family-2 protein